MHEHSRYLIASEQDTHWGLTVNTAGSQHIEPGEPYPPLGHPVRYLFSRAKPVFNVGLHEEIVSLHAGNESAEKQGTAH
jgi:hypothetical protein